MCTLHKMYTSSCAAWPAISPAQSPLPRVDCQSCAQDTNKSESFMVVFPTTTDTGQIGTFDLCVTSAQIFFTKIFELLFSHKTLQVHLVMFIKICRLNMSHLILTNRETYYQSSSFSTLSCPLVHSVFRS